jgi:hypothetical protein
LERHKRKERQAWWITKIRRSRAGFHGQATRTETDPASVGLCELLFGLAKGKVDEVLVAGTPCTYRAPITACATRR